MSLINRMLSDLEARRGGALPAGEAVLADLRAVPARELDRRTRRHGAGFVLAMCVVGAAAWFARGVLDATSASDQLRASAAPVQPLPTPPAPAAPAAVAEDALEPGIAVAPTPPVDPHAADAAPAPRVATFPPVLAGHDADIVAPPAPSVEPAVAAAVTAPPAEPVVEYVGSIRKDHARPSDRRDELAALAQRLRRERSAAARTALAAFVTRHADYAAARELLVGELVRNGERATAEAVLRAGLVASPEVYVFPRTLAHLLVERGDLAAALRVLEAAPVPVAERAEHAAFAAALYQRSGRHGDAIAAYRHALSAEEARGAWWIGLAISLHAEAQHVAALTAFERALTDRTLSDQLRRYAEGERARLAGNG